MMPDKGRRETRGRERSASPPWAGNKYPLAYFIILLEASEAEDQEVHIWIEGRRQFHPSDAEMRTFNR